MGVLDRIISDCLSAVGEAQSEIRKREIDQEIEENLEAAALLSARDVTPEEERLRANVAENQKVRIMLDNAGIYSREGMRNLSPEEIKQRDIEWNRFMQDRGMSSHAGMMNANRYNIVDRIIVAAENIARSGREPSAVYLGEAEVVELKAYAEKLKMMTNVDMPTDETACGYDLVEVKKESYFAVH